MDPITLAIVTSVLGNLIYDGIKEAYLSLKTALQDKYGVGSEIVQAINNLERKPESQARQAMLQEEVIGSGANLDPDLLHFANTLIEKLNEYTSGKIEIKQDIKIHGDRNIVTGHGDVKLST
jgi:hypothetical protein